MDGSPNSTYPYPPRGRWERWKLRFASAEGASGENVRDLVNPNAKIALCSGS